MSRAPGLRSLVHPSCRPRAVGCVGRGGAGTSRPGPALLVCAQARCRRARPCGWRDARPTMTLDRTADGVPRSAIQIAYCDTQISLSCGRCGRLVYQAAARAVAPRTDAACSGEQPLRGRAPGLRGRAILAGSTSAGARHRAARGASRPNRPLSHFLSTSTPPCGSA